MTDRRESAPIEAESADRRLRQFFGEVHADDREPSFRNLVERAARPQDSSRGAARLWRPAFAVLAVLVMAAGVAWLMPGLRDSAPSAALSETEQIALAQELSSWRAPLDFLLDTPGRDLLTTPPTFGLERFALGTELREPHPEETEP